MNRIRSLLAGLAIGVVGIGVGSAAPIIGPQDPANFIRSLNETVLNWMSFPAAEMGELQMLGSRAFAANHTTATTMTSLGPVGAHTTVQEWLVVVNPAGTIRYIPAY